LLHLENAPEFKPKALKRGTKKGCRCPAAPVMTLTPFGKAGTSPGGEAAGRGAAV
jgi:hypothetical protein